ncbi:MAG: hypothetical protein JWO76_521 [Nocardioides sp.]|nr:hypothetical protein [Nocardioides sp.]
MSRLLALPAVVVAAVLVVGCAAMPEPEPAPHAEPSSASGPASVRVRVELGHCFVEPVSFDGEMWNVAFEDQFGWGGVPPRHWRGTGVIERVDDDEARFRDDGGATVVFRPLDDPSVRRVERAPCD